VLETLAAALAEAGETARAARTVDVALMLAEREPELAARLKRQRAVYAAGKAYRDPAMSSAEP
jgi:hypothetical protein